jgi:two-component system, NtrC family, response regulator HydG
MNQKLRILIVDDDTRMTRTLADIFSIAGHQPVEANSGPQALDLARQQSFDCVLTDVRMPGMDGVELHRQLHQVQPGLPVVLMTAYASDEIIRKGLAEGVVGVFDKPLDISSLLGFFTSLARQRSIVIVDDDPDFCKTLGDILHQRGFSVSHFYYPPPEVELMTAEAQVILLDMKLNGISGLDVLKQIRQRYLDLPVLMVTAYRQEMTTAIQAALAINAYTCLYKPLEIPSLLRMLSDFQLKRLRKVMKKKAG